MMNERENQLTFEEGKVLVMCYLSSLMFDKSCTLVHCLINACMDLPNLNMQEDRRPLQIRFLSASGKSEASKACTVSVLKEATAKVVLPISMFHASAP